MRKIHALFAFFMLVIAGCSTDSNTGITTVIPLAPSNLTATVISTTQVNLAWTDNSTNESGYKVQRKTTGGFADVGSTGPDMIAFNDVNLTPNTTYTYRVYAYNSAGNSLQYSNEVTVTTNLIPIITTALISDTTAVSATCGGNITSDAGSPVTARGVCWSTTSGPTVALSTKTNDGTGTGSFTSSITGLSANTTYYVRAYATNSAGTAYGNQLIFNTLSAITLPAAPTNLTATVISSTQVNLSWTDNATNENGYKIERKRDISNYALVGTTGVDLTTFSDLNLSPNTTYTYRVYAYNSAGNSIQYSNEVTVTTNLQPYSYTAGPNVTDINGNIYPSIITSCGQTWTTKNLNVSRYRNGDIIPQITDPTQWANLTTGAWCWYNNDSANYWQYGKLYNWYAVNDSRGLAPQGWHVPTDGEWNKLTKCIDPTADTTQLSSNVAGSAMKTTTGWINSGNGTNSSGFAGLPGGLCSSSGSSFVGEGGYWWSASKNSIVDAWSRTLSYGSSYVYRYNAGLNSGFSVRLIRD